MAIRIVSDSSCDIWNLEGVDFKTVPLTIYTDEKSYVDDENLDIHEMLDYLAGYKNRSYTSCPNVEGWGEAFDGADEIIVTTLTSGLSGTYNAAQNAKDIYLESHPNAKIYVVDSLSTSVEMLLIIYKIRELILEGKSFEEICEAAEEYKKHTRLFFAFKSLHNFAQNGRVPKILAQAIGLLGISIIGTASEKGTVEPIGKSRGEKAVVASVLSQLEKAGLKKGRVNICHVENEELAIVVSKAVKEKFPEAKVNDVYPSRGLVAYYAERGGIIIGCECE